MNDSESQFHYADRSVHSPSSITALCSVAGNFLVCFFCMEMWVDAENGGAKENRVKLRKISKIIKENTRKGLASMLSAAADHLVDGSGERRTSPVNSIERSLSRAV